MTLTETLVIVLGIFASIFLIISSLSTSRPRLLMFSIFCSVFAIAQFTLAGALVAGAVIAVGVVRNSLLLLSLKNQKFRWLDHWAVMVLFMVAASVVWTLLVDWKSFEVLSVVPLAGSLLGSVAVFFRNLIYTKSIFMFAGMMWISYQFSYGAYGLLVGEAANLVSNGVALTLLIRAAVTGQKVIDPTTEVIKTITTAIPAVTATITTAIPVITSSIPKMKNGELDSSSKSAGQ